MPTPALNSNAFCDNCGASGHRDLGRIAPEGWFYVEIKLAETIDGSVFYILACSEKCCQVTWKPGPGNLKDPDPERFPGRDKTIRSRFARLDDEE